MKPLASMVLEMKNKGKYFQAPETHQKGKVAFERSLFEPPTLEESANFPTSFTEFGHRMQKL